jgi:ferric-dicitrate binding protein FerR (iron transport regulator)
VHLNAVSSISYPKEFDNNNRDVKISGEVYFDIARDESRPFTIKVKDYEVEVLGTSFNIKAYEDDEEFTVTVESGVVSVMLNSEEIKPVVLTKNQKLVFSTTTEELKVLNVNADDELYWRKGILYFDSTPMAEVEKMIERWYGIELIIEDEEIYDLAINGTHQNKSLKSVMESIRILTRTNYLIKDNSIIIKN